MHNVLQLITPTVNGRNTTIGASLSRLRGLYTAALTCVIATALLISLGAAAHSQTVSVTISPSATTVCVNTQVTLTATATSIGGESGGGVSYLWYVNNVLQSLQTGVPANQYKYTPTSAVTTVIKCTATINGVNGSGTATVTAANPGVTLSPATATPTSGIEF